MNVGARNLRVFPRENDLLEDPLNPGHFYSTKASLDTWRTVEGKDELESIPLILEYAQDSELSDDGREAQSQDRAPIQFR